MLVHLTNGSALLWLAPLARRRRRSNSLTNTDFSFSSFQQLTTWSALSSVHSSTFTIYWRTLSSAIRMEEPSKSVTNETNISDGCSCDLKGPGTSDTENEGRQQNTAAFNIARPLKYELNSATFLPSCVNGRSYRSGLRFYPNRSNLKIFRLLLLKW